MELSPRLRAVAELVKPGARLADVGTDHAYLPAWLLLRGVISRAVASDLRPGPLERARETAEKYGLTEKIDFRLCNGLDGVSPGEVDTVAIAGMGGETIAQILARAPWARREGMALALQPMSKQPELRQWLAEHGCRIEQERVAREGETLYTVLLVRAGEQGPMTPAQLWAGRQSGEALRGALLEQLIAKAARALAGQRGAARRDEAAIRRTEEVLDGLTAMKKEWDAWQR